MSIEPVITPPERRTPEQAARHILRLIVGHFHAVPGRVLKDASLFRIFASEGWGLPDYPTGRAYAVEHGWLEAPLDDSVTLTSGGYRAAFVSRIDEPSAKEHPRI
jgi:hypothetical protein